LSGTNSTHGDSRACASTIYFVRDDTEKFAVPLGHTVALDEIDVVVMVF
jgi:hypothetical protein